MNEIERSERGSAVVVENIVELDGLRVSLILDPPQTADLFRDRVDLAVVSDFVGFSAFARLVDSSSPATVGFLPPDCLNGIVERFGHRAKNPMGLIREAPESRLRPHKIDLHCSLLYLGLFDRQYARKFVLFVPALTGSDAERTGLCIKRYVDATMCVAAYTRSQSLYFAGFGGVDGSFSNEAIVRLTAKIFVARRCLNLRALHVYFKYSPMVVGYKIDQLAGRLAEELHTEASPVERVDQVNDTIWPSRYFAPGFAPH